MKTGSTDNSLVLLGKKGQDAITSSMKPHNAEALALHIKHLGVSTQTLKVEGGAVKLYISELTDGVEDVFYRFKKESNIC